MEGEWCEARPVDDALSATISWNPNVSCCGAGGAMLRTRRTCWKWQETVWRSHAVLGSTQCRCCCFPAETKRFSHSLDQTAGASTWLCSITPTFERHHQRVAGPHATSTGIQATQVNYIIASCHGPEARYAENKKMRFRSSVNHDGFLLQ